MKISKRFKKDWEFYSNNLKFARFWGGSPINDPVYDKNGLTAAECSFVFESTGELKPCKHPYKFKVIGRVKAGINFHIKMWVDGYDDCGEDIKYYMEEFNDPPLWVFEAFYGQLYKKYKESRIKNG